MVSMLEGLQIELIELIASKLSPRDLVSFRCTSRTILDKASQGCFKNLLKKKFIQVTVKDLKKLVHFTSHGRKLGLHIEELYLIGIIEKDDNSTEKSGLLVEAFKNLAQVQGLRHLCLQVAVPALPSREENATSPKPEIDEASEPADDADELLPTWRQVWETATLTFELTMKALEDSRLVIHERFDVFGGLTGVSLSMEVFLNAISQLAVTTRQLASLRVLSVRLSASVDEEAAPDSWQTPNPAQTPNTSLLPSVLAVLPVLRGLKALDLHWYEIPAATKTAPPPPVKPEAPKYSELHDLSVHGVHTTQTTLLETLHALRPKWLTLQNVDLVSGKLEPVLAYLTSPDSPVTRLSLDDLFEDRRLVHFKVPGEPKFPWRNAQHLGPSTINLNYTNCDPREPLQYQLPPGRVVGSGPRMRWLAARQREYGPARRYDFVDNTRQIDNDMLARTPRALRVWDAYRYFYSQGQEGTVEERDSDELAQSS